jgi:DNA-binding response OmpR family regulator
MPADNRVLILDMRPARRNRLAASLSQLGYVAMFAETVAAAQTLGEAFRIVIADLPNPRLEIDQLRMQLPGSAILAMGARSPAAVLAAWRAGVDGYLPRPLRDAELAVALEHTLRARASRAVPEQSSGRPEFHRTAAELARQINAPLAPILGMADLLAEELPPDHPAHEYAQAISVAALRIRDVAWMLADLGQQGE